MAQQVLAKTWTSSYRLSWHKLTYTAGSWSFWIFDHFDFFPHSKLKTSLFWYLPQATQSLSTTKMIIRVALEPNVYQYYWLEYHKTKVSSSNLSVSWSVGCLILFSVLCTYCRFQDMEKDHFQNGHPCQTR